MHDTEHYLRTFSDLLYDAVYLLYFAFDLNQDDYNDDVIGPHIRGSILSSLLMPECAANCLIDSLDLANQFYKDIDKLSPISKFEFYLKTIKPNQKLDRGCKEVQAIQELQSVRNFYVHPKVKKSKYQSIGEGVWTIDYGQTNLLKFPRAPHSWKKDNAILALKSLNNFFNTYFLDWCGLNTDNVVDLLISNSKVSLNTPASNYIDCVGGLDRAVKEWGVDFKFLGKRASFLSPLLEK